MAKDFEALVSGATQAFTDAPEKATFVFNCDTTLIEDTECTNCVRSHTFTIDEPAELGGNDNGANPVEMILASLAACRAITYQFHAGRLGVPIKGMSISLSGNLDLRGFLGMDPSIRPGFAGITGECTLICDASAHQIEALHEAVNQFCPVADIVKNGVPVAIDNKVISASANAAQ